MKNSNDKNFLMHGAWLAAAGIIVRFIGMIYRIPMVNIIGSEGNGYYSNAYSIYNILLLLSSYSLPLAVSKLVSSRKALRRWKEIKRILFVSFGFAVIVGLVFAALTYFCADFFCTTILSSPKSAIALKWLAPTVFIVAVLGVLRGFFQGLETTIPTAYSQVIEQIANALFSIGFAALLFSHGSKVAALNGDSSYASAWGAAGGTIGTGLGALAALVFLILTFVSYRKNFRAYIKNDPSQRVRTYKKLTRLLVFTAVPVILSAAVYNCIDIIDSAIFNGYSSAHGISVKSYTATWGDYNSAYLLLIHLPVAIASSLASALVPSLSAVYTEGNQKECLKKIMLTIQVSLLIAIPCAFGYMAVGGNLAKLLFPTTGPDAQKYLVAGGVAVIFFSLSTVTNAILQAIDELGKPVKNGIISLGIHVAFLLLFLFVFRIGIYSVIISYVIFGLSMTVLNLRSLYKLTGYLPDPLKTIALPCGVSLLMVLLCFLISFIVSRFLGGAGGNLLIVLFSVLFGGAVYIAGVLMLQCIDPELLPEIPGGKFFAKLSAKLPRLIKRSKDV